MEENFNYEEAMAKLNAAKALTPEQLAKKLEEAQRVAQETLAKMTPEERKRAEEEAQKMIREDEQKRKALLESAQQVLGTRTPKFCPYCGTPNSGSNFCPNCGGSMKSN
ncbi:MAG: zinc ribbon domain-containing protein [Lachnospiraceae bacterium]|nr:zinc ribbon domain-containing protein [Lachnospiraceae bacterium]